MDRDECRRHGGHDSGKLEKERGGFRQKTILGTANALCTARWRRKQQTLFVAVLEERARMQFQEGRKRLEGFRQIMDSYDSGRWWVRETLRRAARAIRFSLERGDRTADECEK